MSVRLAAFPKCFSHEIGLYRTMSVFDWISMARGKLDVEGLEMYDRFFTSLDRDYLRGVVDAVHEAGFVIPMMICSPDFTNPNPDSRKKALEYEAKMIETAATLGGKGTVCRILSGQQYAGVSRNEGVEWVVEAIQKLIPIAKEHGVVLGLENHYKDSQWRSPEFAAKMDVFLEIVESIEEREHFGVQYDPSNAVIAGDDAIALLDAVKDRIVSMHASDRHLAEEIPDNEERQSLNPAEYPSRLVHGVVGNGLNDYDRIFRILAEAGFDGWVSIEDGLNGLEEIEASARFLQALRAKYFPERVESGPRKTHR
jgi:sugar phosphate isomerase/epimerase